MTGILCLGQALVDVRARVRDPIAFGTDTPTQIVTTVGGAAANVASWLAALGEPAMLVATVGDDVFGRFLREELTREHLTLALATDPHRATGCCIVIVDDTGERSMLPSHGAARSLTVPRGTPERAELLYVSGYALFNSWSNEATRAALAAARAANRPIAVDAASAADLIGVGGEELEEWFGTDIILFANLDEARILTGLAAPPAELARAIASVAGTAVVKAGADGAWCAVGDTVVHAPAVPATVVDSTGAGDAFAAGVLTARRRGQSWADALALGVHTAARAVAQVGASPPR